MALSFQSKITPVSSGKSLSFADKIKPVVSATPPSATPPQTDSMAGTLTAPLREGISGLKTLYGGGPEGIANKLKTDVQEGAKDMQNGNLEKGAIKSGLRTAGDVVGTVLAPVGAAFNATGVSKAFDYVGGHYNDVLKKLTGSGLDDIPELQKFAMAHPNAGEDFGRALNLAMAGSETSRIDPSTVVERTAGQMSDVLNTVKDKIATNPEDIYAKRAEDLAKIESNYATTRKANQYSKDNGEASRQRIAKTDVLVGSVDNTGTLRTTQSGGAIEQYRALTIDPAESLVRKMLEKEGASVNLGDVQAELEKNITASTLTGGALKSALNGVQSEIEGLKLKAGIDPSLPANKVEVPLANIHDAKINQTNNINYQTPPDVKTAAKTMASTYKTLVEDHSNLNIGEVNGELSKYLQDISLLERLDGKKVQGGKLGKYFAQISGNLIGAATGGAVGGPIGSALGTIAGGEMGARIKGGIMANTFGDATNPPKPSSPILDKAIEYTKTPGEPQSKSLGNRNQQYSPTPMTSNSDIPSESTTIPKELQPLAEEAKKYKSAEEFVNSQTKLLHGTNKKFDVFDPAKMGTNEKNFAAKHSFFFTDSADTAKSYGKNIKEVYGKFDNPVTIDADGKMFGDMRDAIDEAVTKAKENGNDAVIIKNLSDRKDWGNYEPATHYAVFDTTKLQTKSQLTDFYNKVTKKK